MNDDYSFEDKMKSLFDEERDHTYEPQQWQRLARRLKDHDQPTVAWWQRWMPVGFALLIGLLGWQVWQQRTLQQQVTELSEQLALSENYQQTTTSKRRESVILYDTVYQTIVIENTVSSDEQRIPRKGPAIGRSLQSLSYMPAYSFFPEGGVTNGRPTSPPDFDLLATAGQDFQRYRTLKATALVSEQSKADGIRGPYFITDLITTEQLQQLPFSGIAPPTISAPAAAPYELPRPSLWQRVKPKGYAFSLGGGGFKSWAYGDDDGNAFGDLEAELFLGQRFSLTVGAAYFQRRFAAEGEDHELPEGLPSLAPLNEDDELEKVSGNIRQLQFPIGLRYYPLQKGRFSVHLGAGLAPLLGLPSSALRYEFEDDDDEEYTLSLTNVLSENLRYGAVYGSLGLQADLGKHWQLGLTTTVQQPLGTYDFDYQKPSWGRWRIGVGYELR